MKKRIMASVLAIVLVLSLMTTAFAAYGKVQGKITGGNNNGMYWGTDGKLHYISRVYGYAKTTETSAAASAVQNIYAKSTVTDVDSGEVYKQSEGLDHYKTSVSTTTDDFERKDEETEVTVCFTGLHRARYTDDTVSQATSVPLQTTIGGGSLSRTVRKEAESFIDVHAKEAETKANILEKFDVDLSEFSYVSFMALCEDNLPLEQKPLQSILMDIMATVQEGDKIPLGVLYQDGYAYTLQGKADGTWQLIKYCIDSNILNTASENSCNVTSHFAALPDNFEIFLNDYSIVDVLAE